MFIRFNPLQPRLVSQVFSIIDGQKVGVTIHEIDDPVGPWSIIAQRECADRVVGFLKNARLMDIERELVLEHFDAIGTAATRLNRQPRATST